MFNVVSNWFMCFIVSSLLSLVCVAGLIAGWNLTPESSQGSVTRAGRRLIYARVLFGLGCGVILACQGVLWYCFNEPYDSQPYRWFRNHTFSVPLLLMLSAGLSGSACFFTMKSLGEGRRRLFWVTIIVAALTCVAALFLLQILSR